MNLKVLIAGLLMMFGIQGVKAQVGLGTISGYIYEQEDSSKVIPLAKVWIETESGNRITEADFDGKYKIDALKPGTYNLYAKALGFDSTLVTNIHVSADAIETVNVYATSDNILTVVVIEHNPLIVEKDIVRMKVTTEEIAQSPYIRDPKGLLSGKASDIQQVEGTTDIIIRGSRPGDAVYFVDGVKMTDMTSVPGVAIQGMEAYTGGIPAKYGDTTGGVVVLETKGYFDLYYAWKAKQ